MEVIIGYLTQILSMKALKLWITSIVAIFSYLIWWIDVAVKACWMLVFFDFVFWISLAVYSRTYSWKRMMQWLIKFILYWVAMIVWNQIDLLLFHSSIEFWAKNFIILYVWITDGISIIKHLWVMGLKLPQRLIDRLQGIQDNIDIKIP